MAPALPVLVLILILGALTAFAPLAIDMYSPSFPAITAEFGVEPARVRLTLAAYFVGIATGQAISRARRSFSCSFTASPQNTTAYIFPGSAVPMALVIAARGAGATCFHRRAVGRLAVWLPSRHNVPLTIRSFSAWTLFPLR